MPYLDQSHFQNPLQRPLKAIKKNFPLKDPRTAQFKAFFNLICWIFRIILTKQIKLKFFKIES